MTAINEYPCGPACRCNICLLLWYEYAMDILETNGPTEDYVNMLKDEYKKKTGKTPWETYE